MVLKRLEEMMKYEDNSDDSSLSLEVLWRVVNKSCVFAAALLKSQSFQNSWFAAVSFQQCFAVPLHTLEEGTVREKIEGLKQKHMPASQQSRQIPASVASPVRLIIFALFLSLLS